jgi:hypothetical protein
VGQQQDPPGGFPPCLNMQRIARRPGMPFHQAEFPEPGLVDILQTIDGLAVAGWGLEPHQLLNITEDLRRVFLQVGKQFSHESSTENLNDRKGRLSRH